VVVSADGARNKEPIVPRNLLLDVVPDRVVLAEVLRAGGTLEKVDARDVDRAYAKTARAERLGPVGHDL
jgi:hypothetical protein